MLPRGRARARVVFGAHRARPAPCQLLRSYPYTSDMNSLRLVHDRMEPGAVRSDPAYAGAGQRGEAACDVLRDRMREGFGTG